MKGNEECVPSARYIMVVFMQINNKLYSSGRKRISFEYLGLIKPFQWIWFCQRRSCRLLTANFGKWIHVWILLRLLFTKFKIFWEISKTNSHLIRGEKLIACTFEKISDLRKTQRQVWFWEKNKMVVQFSEKNWILFSNLGFEKISALMAQTSDESA